MGLFAPEKVWMKVTAKNGAIVRETQGYDDAGSLLKAPTKKKELTSEQVRQANFSICFFIFIFYFFVISIQLQCHRIFTKRLQANVL